MANNKEKPQCVVIAGGIASGRHAFLGNFRHSFALDFPYRKLEDGTKSKRSFVTILSLSPDEVLKIKQLEKLGYRLTLYYLFTGSKLAYYRSFSKSIVNKNNFNENEIEASYSYTYKGLASCIQSFDLVFFLKNFKDLEFVSAYEPKTMKEEELATAIISLKREAEGE